MLPVVNGAGQRNSLNVIDFLLITFFSRAAKEHSPRFGWKVPFMYTRTGAKSLFEWMSPGRTSVSQLKVIQSLIAFQISSSIIRSTWCAYFRKCFSCRFWEATLKCSWKGTVQFICLRVTIDFSLFNNAKTAELVYHYNPGNSLLFKIMG